MRYPGGKSKLKKKILPFIVPSSDVVEYREPFFGGGSIGVDFLSSSSIPQVWVNDFDKHLANMWNSVIHNPEPLKEMIRSFKPTVQSFYDFKAALTSDMADSVTSGFYKLAIHQMSYSGLGVKAGGPIGGVNQTSNYSVDCRWSPDNICKKIDKIHTMLSSKQTKCTSVSFEDVILDESVKAFLYLDPPYYDKGGDLYFHAFNHQQHVDLSQLLRQSNHEWVLSYDDMPEIRNMYSWAKITEIDATYTITSVIGENDIRASNRKVELVITK